MVCPEAGDSRPQLASQQAPRTGVSSSPPRDPTGQLACDPPVNRGPAVFHRKPPADVPSNARWAAVLWDLDGTLVDTERAALHIIDALLKRYATEHGLQAEMAQALRGGEELWTLADHMRIIGTKGESWAPIALGKVPGLPEKVTWPEMCRDWDSELGDVYARVPVLPGAGALTARLASVPTRYTDNTSTSEAGASAGAIPQAICTSSGADAVAKKRKAFPKLFERMQAVVCGDDVQRGKPHPDPFLMAARKLDIDTDDAAAMQRCVAFEDSEAGCKSARAAGCYVVAVPHSGMAEDEVERRFTAEVCDCVLRSLMDEAALEAMFGETERGGSTRVRDDW